MVALSSVAHQNAVDDVATPRPRTRRPRPPRRSRCAWSARTASTRCSRPSSAARSLRLARPRFARAQRAPSPSPSPCCPAHASPRPRPHAPSARPAEVRQEVRRQRAAPCPLDPPVLSDVRALAACPHSLAVPQASARLVLPLIISCTSPRAVLSAPRAGLLVTFFYVLQAAIHAVSECALTPLHCARHL